ncbi:MAG: GNAT family N-acetyltransferase [Halanaerobiales bacterium]
MIRKARLPDVETIVNNNYKMAQETENHELDKNILRKGVTEAVLDDSKACYYLYEEDKKIIGQIMITKEWSDWREGYFWWIQSVYVGKEHRRKGVFRKLFQYIKNLAQEDEEVCGLRLYVEENNKIAQSTYKNLGLDKTSYLMYECEI